MGTTRRPRVAGGGIALLLRLRRALAVELARTSRPMFAALAVSMVIPGLLSGGFIVVTGIVVGAVPGAVRHGLHSASGHTLLTGLVAAGVLYAVQMVLSPLRAALCDVFGRRLEGRLRGRVMTAVLTPPGVSHLERPDVLDQVSLAQTVGIGEIRPRAVVLALTEKYSEQMQGYIAAALLFGYSWWAPLAFTGGWVLLRYAWMRRLRDSVQLNALQTRSLRRSAYFRDLALTAPAAKETRIFGLDMWLARRFTALWADAMTLVWRERRKAGPLLWLAILLLALVHLGVLLAIGQAAAGHSVSLTALAVYLQAILGTAGIASYDMDHKIDSGSRPIVATQELERDLARPQFRMPGDEPAAGLPRDSIRFDNVTFRYSGQRADVFDGLDLDLPAGRSIAIVGENGAGKTTLVKLLARLYDPDGGRILVDGVDLKRLDAGQWARRVAAIFQDFVRYKLTAAQNVGFGGLTLADDRAALASAAARAGAGEVIEALPHGWDTVLSPEFDGGADLSGGQWQRIALARALLAVEAGAGVLVLDEPTAHLDARAEAQFFDHFLELTEGKTTIVISHRFSTVRRADRIVVLDHGRVAEQGSHDELVAAGGRYARMFALQAARFASPAAAEGDGHA